MVWGHMFDGNLYATFIGWIAPRTKSVITLHTEGYSQSPPRTIKGRLFVSSRRCCSAGQPRKPPSRVQWRAISKPFSAGATSPSYITAWSPARSRRRRTTPGGCKFARNMAFPDDFMIVTPSRFIPKKGHAVLLNALDILNREKSWLPRLVACGFVTPFLDQLRARASELGLAEAVEFSPPLAHDQLFALTQAADAVVIPSLREPFGIAAAEAMSLGVPVVLTRVDGFIELVGDSEGALMASPGDARSSCGGDLVAEGRPRFAPAGGRTRAGADRGEF